ncbi:hypothetical protein AB0F17_62365 [Nonomuraea sp. NPDC026600]|uniref:hypothetical protein n=1 Tax=Nonomuraea sp. NPDC026600 TaxID=3155363 RepID=UPI0033D0269B
MKNPQAAAEQAIRDFPFCDYGLNGVSPESEHAEWVPDLAKAVTAAIDRQAGEAP